MVNAIKRMTEKDSLLPPFSHLDPCIFYLAISVAMTTSSKQLVKWMPDARCRLDMARVIATCSHVANVATTSRYLKLRISCCCRRCCCRCCRCQLRLTHTFHAFCCCLHRVCEPHFLPVPPDSFSPLVFRPFQLPVLRAKVSITFATCHSTHIVRVAMLHVATAAVNLHCGFFVYGYGWTFNHFEGISTRELSVIDSEHE